MKKIISSLIVFSLIICFITPALAYTPKSSDDTTAQAMQHRFETFTENEIRSWDSKRTIGEIKQVSDFDGNSYTVVEFQPTGYLIFNNESATVVEKAENSPSPYLGLYGALYYGGPTHYYQYSDSDDIYRHTVLNEDMGIAEAAARATACRQAQTILNSTSNEDLKSYLETGVASNKVMQTANSAYEYVGDNREFFEEMNTASEMGYWDLGPGNGVCGYIAAGIMLLYHDNFLDDDFIDDDEYSLEDTRYGKYFSDTTFSKYLYNTIGEDLGYGLKLNAAQVSNLMTTYLETDRDIGVYTWVLNFPSKESVVAQLKLDRPVVYVDRWDDPSKPGGTTDHDIVVYGYNDDNNSIIAHFGWPGYTHIEATSGIFATFISSACSIGSIKE